MSYAHRNSDLRGSPQNRSAPGIEMGMNNTVTPSCDLFGQTPRKGHQVRGLGAREYFGTQDSGHMSEVTGLCPDSTSIYVELPPVIVLEYLQELSLRSASAKRVYYVQDSDHE